MADFRPGTPEQAAFLGELLDARPADRDRRARASTAAAADFEDVRLSAVAALVTRARRRRSARAAALPAGPATPRPGDSRLPQILSRTWRAAIFAFEGSEAEAAEQYERALPPRGLERVPVDDRPRAHAGRLLPGVSGDRGPRGRWRPAG